jgi:hypothetical protein
MRYSNTRRMASVLALIVAGLVSSCAEPTKVETGDALFISLKNETNDFDLGAPTTAEFRIFYRGENQIFPRTLAPGQADLDVFLLVDPEDPSVEITATVPGHGVIRKTCVYSGEEPGRDRLVTLAGHDFPVQTYLLICWFW